MSERANRNPDGILNEIKEWIDLSQKAKDGFVPFEVSFGDGSSWLNITGEHRPQDWQHGKLVGWLEALCFVQGKSFAETKDYVKKLGLYNYEKPDLPSLR